MNEVVGVCTRWPNIARVLSHPKFSFTLRVWCTNPSHKREVWEGRIDHFGDTLVLVESLTSLEEVLEALDRQLTKGEQDEHRDESSLTLCSWYKAIFPD